MKHGRPRGRLAPAATVRGMTDPLAALRASLAERLAALRGG